MSQKIVLKVHLNCEKCKQRVMKTVAGIEGVVSVAVDEKDNKVTVIGDADPVCLTARLRKRGFAELVSVGPSKEPNPPKQPPPEKEKAKEPPAKKQEASQPNFTYVVLPTSCQHCSSYNYYFSDENTKGCSIL